MLRADARIVETGGDRLRPPAPGRTRPASGSCACRAPRRARRGRPPHRRPARRRPGERRCRRSRRRCRSRSSRRRRTRRRRRVRRRTVRRHCSRGLVADDSVELADHPRIRVRTHDRAEAVVRRLDRRDPVAHRLVDRVLQRAAAALHGFDLGSEQLHPKHVQGLAVDVDGAHVHLALHTEQRRSGGAGDAVLTGTGLGDECASCPCAWPAGPARARC